ncbi:MAG: hypothetical protein C4576_26915 [Desulfobacteraceae bacterium]|nr:MAG: hypothetical protein C4576_26915 [Desulfobacteraceae bacterium]
MTDEQVEKLIWKEIKKRQILFQDMVGMPNCGVDPNPEDIITPRSEKGIRSNRFKGMLGSERMKELLCVGRYSEWVDYPPLKITFQDLFRFWWNRCVDQDVIVDDVLNDIFDHFLELMRPPEKEEPEMDMTVDFEQMPLFIEKTEKAA